MAQIQLEVTDPVANTVRFVIGNLGPEDSTVATIFFDDDLIPPLVGPGVIENGPGVSFAVGTGTSTLPGGSTFVADAVYDADKPAPQNGVNPGEWVAITFGLPDSLILADVLDALHNQTLRVGIHVIAFANGQSETLLVPEPGTLLLLGLGCMTLMGPRRLFRLKR